MIRNDPLKRFDIFTNSLKTKKHPYFLKEKRKASHRLEL